MNVEDLNKVKQIDMVEYIKKTGIYDAFFAAFQKQTKLSDDDIHNIMLKKIQNSNSMKSSIIQTFEDEQVQEALKSTARKKTKK